MIVDPLIPISAALAALPARMDSPEARVMLVAIGLQESRFVHRAQVPVAHAKGFWQFERGGGVAGVLRHPASQALAKEACFFADVAPNPTDVWNALEHDDVLAATFARLLLWTDPRALPPVGDTNGAWDLYLRTWRPGKPHPQTWPKLHAKARELVL